MNILDWILLGFLLLAAMRGLSRGLVQELSTVAAPVAGLAAGIFLYKWGAEVLRTRLHLETLPELVAFGVLFLIGFAVVKVVATMIHEGIEAAELDKVDRSLGLVLGLVEGLVVVALILIILQVQPLADASKLLAGSWFARTLLPLVGPEVAKAFDALGKTAADSVQIKPAIKPVVKP